MLENVKLNKKIIIISICVLFIICIIIYIFNINKNKTRIINNSKNVNAGNIYVNSSDVLDASSMKNYLVSGNFLEDGVVSNLELMAMNNNTSYLQKLIDNAKSGSIINIPAGIFYFTSSGMNNDKTEDFVIKLRSDVSVVGAGIDETDSFNYTVLKPYAKSGDVAYGLDMFYYNYYRDSGWTNPLYLENVYFSNFIIDGEAVRGNSYNSSGKGFMVNLCKNCHWENIIVRNTDATGFGIDNIINGSIKNSKAINCGKNANKDSNGASGFGIGTGFSNDEYMYIENCESIDNKRYGFLFEHQGRFSDNYNAIMSSGFVVVNSKASGNLYNFGGERSNDVVYINCDSNRSNYTKLDVYFSDQSRRSFAVNMNVNDNFIDVTDSSSYYYDAVKWGLSSGIVNGIGDNKFGAGRLISRVEALVMLWRMAGREGNVLGADELSSSNRSNTNIDTGFSDVGGDSWYVSAIKWAVDTGITNGITNKSFGPDDIITRAQFVTMLWRYAGSPVVNYNNVFTDIKSGSYYYDAVIWASSEGITNGITGDKFDPNGNCTREQVVTFLYRYQNSMGVRFPIKYFLMGGSLRSSNASFYVSGSTSFTLNNPGFNGYKFVGWIGSNGINPGNVSINSNDVGNKIYVARYDKLNKN